MRVASLATDTDFNIQQSEQALQTALQQISTGLSVNQPSDNPAASANYVISVAGSASIDQFTSNITAASAQLQTADASLSSVVSSLTSAISIGTEGANGTASSADAQNLSTQVQTILNNVVAQANSTSQGTYVFGGTANSYAPVQPSAESYETQNAQVEPPLVATSPLTAGSTIVITDAATGKSFVFTVTAGETISNLNAAIAGAASSGDLPSGTTTTISNGQFKISSGSSTDGIAVASNDPVFGNFNAVSGTEIANQYAYVGNSSVNTVQVGSSLTVNTNVPGNQIFVGGANAIGALSGLVTALNSGSQAAVQSATQAVSTALHGLTQARVPFDNGISQLNAQESFLSQEKVTLSTQQKSLIGADIATSAVNLSQAEVQNSALLAASAKVLPQNLLNYLS